MASAPAGDPTTLIKVVHGLHPLDELDQVRAEADTGFRVAGIVVITVFTGCHLRVIVLSTGTG